MDRGDLVPDRACVHGGGRPRHPRRKEKGLPAPSQRLSGGRHRQGGHRARHLPPLDVPDEMLIERVVGRRPDPETGKIYHPRSPPPEDVVDRLTQRSDDTEEKAKNRLQVHHPTSRRSSASTRTSSRRSTVTAQAGGVDDICGHRRDVIRPSGQSTRRETAKRRASACGVTRTQVDIHHTFERGGHEEPTPPFTAHVAVVHICTGSNGTSAAVDSLPSTGAATTFLDVFHPSPSPRGVHADAA